MAKEKAKYEVTEDAVLRNGEKVASISEEGEVTLEKGMTKYRMPVTNVIQALKKKQATKKAPVEPIPDDDCLDEDNPTIEAMEGESLVDLKNRTHDLEPERPTKRRTKRNPHNPFGWPEKDCPDCPKGDPEMGNKSPEVVEWVKDYYPEMEDETYGDWYDKIEWRQKKEALKQARLEAIRAGR